MKTEIIKQIQKIAGIKTVEIAGKDMAIVIFEGENEKELALIEEAIRRGFVMGAVHGGIRSGGREFEITEPLYFIWGYLFGGREGCIYSCGKWAELIPEKPKPLFITEDGVEIFTNGRYWMVWESSGWQMDVCYAAGTLSPDTWRFSTEEAAQAYIQKQQQPKATDQARCYMNALSDTIKELLSRPKSLKPEELVDGEIYNYDGVIRFRKQMSNDLVYYYSIIFSNGDFSSVGGYIDYTSLRPATLLEKQQLITEEVKNGFYFNLK